MAMYHEQEVAVAFGTMGITDDGHVRILTRQIEADQIVSVVPSTQGDLKLPATVQTPRVTELLRKAIEWRRQLDADEVRNQAEIARRESITRARVTQIMGMLRLAPQIQQHILAMPETIHQSTVTDRALRPITSITNPRGQIDAFQKILRTP